MENCLDAWPQPLRPRVQIKPQNSGNDLERTLRPYVPFGVTYEKFGTIQRRLAWPLHKDDTLFRSGRPTGLNIYCLFLHGLRPMLQIHHRLRVVVAQAIMDNHLLDPILTRTRTGHHDENHSREGSKASTIYQPYPLINYQQPSSSRQ